MHCLSKVCQILHDYITAELYVLTPVLMTLTLFQGHRAIGTVKVQVVSRQVIIPYFINNLCLCSFLVVPAKTWIN